MKYDENIGVNWNLKFRLIIEELKNKLEEKSIKLSIAERKLKKYENNNTRTTRNRKNNNVVKLGR